MTKIYPALIALFAIFLPSSASAQWDNFEPYSSDFFSTITWRDINMRSARILKDAQGKGTPSTKTTPKKGTPTPVVRAQPTPKATPAPLASLGFKQSGDIARSKGVQALVSQYPKDRQNEIRANYTAVITSFNDTVPRLYGVQKNNMATGVAALLTGAYSAYYNKPFPDEFVKPLVTQLEASMREDSNLTKASAADKETAYHVMVGMGMTLQVAQLELSKKPDARATARLKSMGAEVFKRLLIEQPDRVVFTKAGMSLR